MCIGRTMYLYRLPMIHFHHVHKDDECYLVQDRFVKQLRMTRYMLVYGLRLVLRIIQRELKQRGVILLCYEHDPYHYMLSRIHVSGYEIPEDTHEWYHLLHGCVSSISFPM